MEPLKHMPKNHVEWNESYYFVFYDLKQGLGGMTRLGFKPNKKEAMTFLFLFLPDGSAAGYQAVEETGDYGLQGLRVGKVVHKPLPEGVWKYFFEGDMIAVRNPEDLPRTRGNPSLASGVFPARVELSLTPISEVYEYSAHMTPESRMLGEKSGDEHWEQIGIVNGEVHLGGETYRVEQSMGQRDHTHGVREWTSIDYWLYYVVWFSRELAVNPAAIIMDDGRVSTGGFLFEKGRNIPIERIRVLEQEFRDEVLPVCSRLELVDGLGRRHVLEARAGPVIPVPFTDSEKNVSILAQSFGSFKLDGVEGGYGSFETLRRKPRK
ncbi:MAG: hypothetical protein FGF51_06480 [Candidatus Brockarchaeota archaeon]|nr:hypothetical protein [Candidatus Brockarchaeota archaeon]